MTWKRNAALLMAYRRDVISISDDNISDVQADPTPAVANYTLQNDGNIGSSEGSKGAWCTPGTSAAAYEVFATVVSGTPSGTYLQWLSLGTSRTFGESRGTPGTTTASISLQIRRINGDGTILDTAAIGFTAQVT